MTLTTTASKVAEKVTLSGAAGRFSLLNVTAPGSPRCFLKEVLRVGRWVHPVTGEVIDIDQTKLERLVSNTQRWLALGHKVFFPDGHTSSALANLGWWSQFFVDGDQAFGVLEVEVDAVVTRLGKTIRDVSVGIWWNPKSSVAPGEDFSGGVFEHVCATPDPVVNAQPNFQALARSGAAHAPTVPAKGKEPRMLVAKLDRTALAKAATGIAPGDAAKLFLGLPADAADQDVVEAMRQYFLGLDEDGLEDPASADQLATMSRDLEGVKAKLASSEAERAKDRAKRAGEKVHAARLASTRSNRPIADEKLKRIEVLLSRDDAESQAQGQELLDAHLELAGGPRPALGPGGSIVNPDRATDDAKRLRRHTSLSRAVSSQGAKVEHDSKGFIVAINGKPYTK